MSLEKAIVLQFFLVCPVLVCYSSEMLQPRLASRQVMTSPTTNWWSGAGSWAPQPRPWALVKKTADCPPQQSGSDAKACFAYVKSTFHAHCTHGGATEGLGGNMLLSETAAFLMAVEAISIVLPNSFHYGSFFNGKTSGSASQPLGYRPTKDQGSSVNRREAEAKHQGLSRGTCNEGGKWSFKISNKTRRPFRTDICVLL